MLSLDEFRTGQLSIPSLDEDALPPCCFACVYLSYKEFSAHYGDGLFYYCCAYFWPDRLNQTVPACLKDIPLSPEPAGR